MLRFLKSFDAFLGRPFQPGFRVLRFLLLPAFAAFILGAYWKSHGGELMGYSIVIMMSVVLFCTPYLIAAGFVFYAFAQLPLADGWTQRMTIQLLVSLAIVAFCLWRTWINWPGIRIGPLPIGEHEAPWWAHLLGAIIAFSLFGFIAYFLYFAQ